MTAPTLAMHMANELLTVPVAAGTLLLAAGAVALAAARARKTLTAERLPLMGVMGAFVFAAQMINFSLPGMPGTSGHLGGGVLLAVLLGPSAAIVTMASILIMQCLLFQDGGLLALGCNIINMGVVPCLLGWGAYRLATLGGGGRPWRLYLAAWGACLLAVTAGAALVPVEAWSSGVLRVPLRDFLGLMVGVHLVIGLIEGAITFSVLAYLRRARPAALGLAAADSPAPGGRGLTRAALAGSLLATALLLAGAVSWFASCDPDGLEASLSRLRLGPSTAAIQAPSPAVAAADDWQARWTPLADYDKRSSPLAQAPAAGSSGECAKANGWTSVAGILGTLVTLCLVYASAVLLRRRSRAAIAAKEM